MLNIHTNDLLRFQNRFQTPVFRSASGQVSVEAAGITSNAFIEIWFLDSQNTPHLFQTHSVKNGHCAFSFDPVSLCIYQDAASFEILLYGFETVTCFLLTEEQATAEKAHESTCILFHDADGNQLVPILQADQTTIRNVSILPKQVLFMGNSILLGMNLNAYGGEYAYGMCASSPEKDYFYIVSQEILKHSPDCKFRKLYGSPFEHADTPEKFEAWWSIENNPCSGAPACESFTENLDLIILQCGDNVNTDEKEARFRIQASFLLQQIKQRCPNARILWVHSWYNFERTNKTILLLQELWRFEEVDIHDLAVPDHQAQSGQCYSTPGGSAIVRDTWVTHPGDLGMEKIAQRILSQLGI